MNFRNNQEDDIEILGRTEKTEAENAETAPDETEKIVEPEESEMEQTTSEALPETSRAPVVETTAAAPVPETTMAATAQFVPETTAAPALTTRYITMYVVNCNEYITLRTAPSTKAAEVRKIPYGQAVSYVETASNGFYKVSYLGDTGYALASYLSETSPAARQPMETAAAGYRTMKVVNCRESITLRTSPSTKAAEIRQIPLGAAVSYIETAANGFYRVVYMGDTGYALDSYLEFQ